MANGLLWAAVGTGFTFLMTAMGAGTVFFFRKSISTCAQRVFLGFAAGVMVAASIWSLIVPAIEEAEAMGQPVLLPAAGGFALGVGFMLLMDALIPHLHLGESHPEGLSTSWQRSTLLFSAVTLHNIPEGMAVGLTFALATEHGGSGAFYAGALALALGMGIQNFPEGAAISLPLRSGGMKAPRAFAFGALSRRCGAGVWHPGGARGRRHSAGHALAAFVCRGIDDVCRSRRADPGSPSGRALSHGHSQRDGRLSRDDDA